MRKQSESEKASSIRDKVTLYVKDDKIRAKIDEYLMKTSHLVHKYFTLLLIPIVFYRGVVYLTDPIFSTMAGLSCVHYRLKHTSSFGPFCTQLGGAKLLYPAH